MRRMPIDFCRSNDSNRKWPPKWPPPVTRSTSRNASKKKIKKIKIKQKKNRRIQEPNLRNQKKEKERKIPLRPPSESITFFRSVFFCNWNPMILVFNFLLMLFFIVFFLFFLLNELVNHESRSWRNWLCLFSVMRLFFFLVSLLWRRESINRY